MRRAQRRGRGGPTGAAPPPPDWLGRVTLTIDVIEAGTALYRVHRQALDPIFFGPGAGVAPTYRFDSATGRFGVLYLGRTLAGAVAETLLRNPQRLMVPYSEIVERVMTELTCRRPLRVVRLYGDGLQAVGTDNAISTGPYEPCGLWSDALWDHSDAPDGVAYQSRHDSTEICLAIFQRDDLIFEPQPPVPLREMLHVIASLLDDRGKSIMMGGA